jgi:hypothetical protein
MKNKGFSGATKLSYTPAECTETVVAEDNVAVSRRPIDESPSGETGLSIVDDINTKLDQLVKALKSSHSSGHEFDASPETYIGIVAFYEYWMTLADQHKSTIFIQIPDLKSYLERLFRPANVDYRGVYFCAALIGDALEKSCQKYNIIQTSNETPSDGLRLRR